jgi:hypothetical protein
MPIEVAACASRGEIMPAISPIFHYFGIHPTPPDGDRFVPFMEPSRVFAARDGRTIVGGCGVPARADGAGRRRTRGGALGGRGAAHAPATRDPA